MARASMMYTAQVFVLFIYYTLVIPPRSNTTTILLLYFYTIVLGSMQLGISMVWVDGGVWQFHRKNARTAHRMEEILTIKNKYFQL